MRRLITLIAIAAVACAVPGLAVSAQAGAGEEVLRADQARQDAFQEGDGAEWSRWVADGCVWTTLGGRVVMNKEGRATRFTERGPAERGSAVRDEVNVHIFGDTAVLTARTSGTNQEGDAWSRRHTRVYVKLDGRWQMVTNHASEIPEQ